MSRDSIGETGGANLYGMVKNNPIYWIDLLGNGYNGFPGSEYTSGGYSPQGAGGYYPQPIRHKNQNRKQISSSKRTVKEVIEKHPLRDWTYDKLKQDLKDVTELTGENNIQVNNKVFWQYIPESIRGRKHARSTYNLGCVGISSLFTGLTKYLNYISWTGTVEAVTFSDDVFEQCFDNYAQAKKARGKLKCKYPTIMGINYANGKRVLGKNDIKNGKYINAKSIQNKAQDGSYRQFDYGFGLEDGSFLHATGAFKDGYRFDNNNRVIISKSHETFSSVYHRSKERLLMYCVFCSKPVCKK